ncbi:hypothetical protein CVT24_013405, partial [Panaeolus cyanescens]
MPVPTATLNASLQATQTSSTSSSQFNSVRSSTATATSTSTTTATATSTSTSSSNGSANANGSHTAGFFDHYHTFQQNSHDLAMVFSQVPWMRFSIVAQPDIHQLANNETLKEFVGHVTSMTIATVSQQIHEEITVAVAAVIKNITSSVNEKMTAVHSNILNEIVKVSAQRTATQYEHLGFPPFNQLVKDIGAKDCACPPSKPDEKPQTVPTPTPAPAPAPTPAPKPTPPVIVKPSIVPAPTFASSSWIWTPEYKSNPRPPVGHTRVFRRTISTPSPVNSLSLRIAADDMYT